MNEPYFEKMEEDRDGIPYPFSCILASGNYDMIYIPPHWHFDIEMLYILKGSLRVLINGEWFSAEEGDLILINTREVHATHAEDGRNTHYIILRFDTSMLYPAPQTIYDTKYILDFTVANTSYQKQYKTRDLKDSNIPEIINKILDEFNERAYGFELAIRVNICRIFVWILRQWHIQGNSKGKEQLPSTLNINILHNILEYIDKHYSENISSSMAAKMCNLSYSHFSREFKRATGKSFKEYINYVRITEAEKLLLTTCSDITSIAQDTGFSTSSYFIEQFKRYKNLSPYQFRKNTGIIKRA